MKCKTPFVFCTHDVPKFSDKWQPLKCDLALDHDISHRINTKVVYTVYWSDKNIEVFRAIQDDKKQTNWGEIIVILHSSLSYTHRYPTPEVRHVFVLIHLPVQDNC